MNEALDRLAAAIGLNEAAHEQLRLAFAYACVSRVRHLLEDQRVIDCLEVLAQYLQGQVNHAALAQVCSEATLLANQHQGSKAIDGCGHAAVSASYAVANALNGKALPAASYAAYAAVYAGGGYGAIVERESFVPEFTWQVETLRQLASTTDSTQLTLQQSEASDFSRNAHTYLGS